MLPERLRFGCKPRDSLSSQRRGWMLTIPEWTRKWTAAADNGAGESGAMIPIRIGGATGGSSCDRTHCPASNGSLIRNIEFAIYDEAADGSTPDTHLMPRVTLYFHW